jgi:hypothetical protein
MNNEKNLFEDYGRICEDDGAINPVNLEFYLSFINMSDDHMKALIRQIIIAQSDDINRIMFSQDQESQDREKDIYNMILNVLSLISHGYLSIGEDGDLRCFKPVGPAPDDETQQLIEKQISHAEGFIYDVFQELSAEQKQRQSSQ